jgi:hypothetical protein
MAFSFACNPTLLDKPAFGFPTDETDVGTNKMWHTPGYRVRSVDGREFMFAGFTSLSGGAAVAGAPAVFVLKTTSTVGIQVSTDISAGSPANVAAFIGPVTNGTSTDTWYCWVQTKGILVKAPSTDGANAQVAALDPLYAVTDGKWTKGTITTHHITASALETAVAGATAATGQGDILLAAR